MSIDPDDALLLATRQLMIALLTHTAASARYLSLSIAEVAALEHLSAMGELTPKQLGLRLAMGSGTVTALLDRLEQAGFVVRVRHPHDRRSYLVHPGGVRAVRVQHERLLLLDQIRSLSIHYAEPERVAIHSYLEALANLIGAQHAG